MEKVSPATPPFEEMLRKGKYTFSRQSGTTAADIHGSTLAMQFYSQKFIDLLRENGITEFSIYKLNFEAAMHNIGNYYHVEFKNILPAKSTVDPVTGIIKSVTFYLKDWKGQDIFTLERTRFVVVTEKLRKIIGKAGLKNFQFREILPVQ